MSFIDNIVNQAKVNYKIAENQVASYLPFGPKNSLREVMEHAVGFAVVTGVFGGVAGISIGVGGILIGAYFARKMYCEFQPEYRTEANFVGGIEIVSAAVLYLHGQATGNKVETSLALPLLAAGIGTIGLHGVVLPAIADEIADCA